MTATPYDLVQDGKILDLDTRQEIVEGVLLDAADPHTGTEFSYPVVGRAWSAQMWQWMAHGMGSGILDAGGQPYWLRNNGTEANTNSTRKMLLTVSTTTNTANAIIRGYFHQLSASMLLDFPMPSAGTITYHVCLTYDPALEKAPQGPISIQRYSGTPPTSGSRLHLTLWTVRCSASQLLTNAVVTQIRPKVAPSMTVDTSDQLPDPSTVLWGTQVTITHGARRDERFIATGASEATGGPTGWRSITDPDWVEFGDSPTYVWPGFGYPRAIQRVGRRRRLRGNVKPRNNSTMNRTSNGYLVATLAASDTPADTEKFMAVGSGHQNAAAVAILVGGRSSADIAGEVRAYPKDPTTWVSLSGITWDV